MSFLTDLLQKLTKGRTFEYSAPQKGAFTPVADLPMHLKDFPLPSMKTPIKEIEQKLKQDKKPAQPLKTQSTKKVFRVSGYSLDSAQTDNRPWEGAYGDDLREDVKKGNLVVASRNLPKGTKVVIGDKTYTVKDKMGPRFEGTDSLDILFPTREAALQFGVQNLPVEIILPETSTSTAKPTSALPFVKTAQAAGAKSMEFPVGGGFTPEMRAYYEKKGVPRPSETVRKPATEVGVQVVNPLRFLGLPSMLIRPNTTVDKFLSGIIEYPERLGRTIQQLPSTFKGKTEPIPMKGAYVPSAQQTMTEIFTAYAQNELPWWIIPLEITGAFVDLTIAGSLLKAGVRAVASRATEAEVQKAWEFLGRPKTTQDMNNAVKELQKIYHPDMPTGNPTKSAAINQARDILVAKGLPKGGILPKMAGIAKELEKPATEAFKGVSAAEYADVRGYLPGLAERPGQIPAFGLSMKEIEPVGKGIIPKGLQPLAQEARKYSNQILRRTESGIFKKFGGRPEDIYDPVGKYYFGEGLGKQPIKGEKFIEIKNPMNNPFIVEYKKGVNWKKQLSESFTNLRGRNLTNALINEGYDGAILVEKGKILEAIDMTDFYNQAVKGVKEVKPERPGGEEEFLRKFYQKELNLIKQEGRLDLSSTIKRLGGIRVSGDIKEEILQNVPQHLFNKKGQSLDEIAQELHNMGFAHIRDGDSLMEELNKMYAQKVEPIVKKDPTSKTQEFQALPDDLKDRITTFFRPSRKLESRAFQLLGNKDTTIPLLRNTFNEWTKSGVETIIEPYAGAYTVGTHGLNEAIKNGLKDFYSNIFDKEKYMIVKAIQDGRMPEVTEAVDLAIKRLSDKVYEYSTGNAKVRKVLDDFFREHPNANIGSREFYSYMRKQPIGSQITVYEDDFKAWSSVFNRAYKDLFIDDPEGLRDAAMTAVLKRIENRSGELITHNGFTSYHNKIYGDRGMLAGLDDMLKTFQLAREYGTNIHLFNKDGAKFIESINAKKLGFDPKKTGYYFAPPYIKSASVYDNAQNLENFASGANLSASHANAFDEAKQGARILLTNDVEAEYIAEMGKRLKNPGLFAYREGVTPTSLITDFNTKPVIDDYLLRAETVAGEREEIAKVKAMMIEKNLSTVTFARIRKNLGIENLKKATDEKLAQLMTFLEKLEPGDKLLTDLQIEASKDLVKENDFVDPINLVTQREFISKYAEQIEVLSKFPERFIMNELFPTVTLKEGHPLVTKIVDKADDLMFEVGEKIKVRDKKFEQMIRKAEKSRKSELGVLERISRKVVPQNKEIFVALSGDPVKLTREEAAVVAYLRNFFKRTREDLRLEHYRRFYVTHLEKPLMEQIFTKGPKEALKNLFSLEKQSGIPVDIMLELDNIIGSEKFFRFALRREGGIDPTTNLRQIMHIYGSLYETKMALDQILPEAQLITRILLKPKTADWMKKYMQNLKGRGLDWRFRTGKMAWLSNVTNKTIDIGYVTGLGLNYVSVLKNELAGISNNYVVQGMSKFLTGQIRFNKAPLKSVNIAMKYGLLEGTFADYANTMVSKVGKGIRMSLIGQKMGEYHIRSSLVAGELTQAEWKSGVLTPERVREIKNLVAFAQGIFSKTESPLWAQHWLGRLMLQFNRWRITNANIFIKSARTAKAEVTKRNFRGPGSKMFLRMLMMYGIGMYLRYKLVEGGYKKSAKIVQTMAEIVNGTIALFTTNELMRMITENYTMTNMRYLFNSIQALSSYVVPGVEKPGKWRYQGGLEDIYFAPAQTIKDILGIEKVKPSSGRSKDTMGMPSMQLPSMQLPSMKMPSMQIK